MNIRVLKFLKQAVHPTTVISGDKDKHYFNTVDINLQKYENIYRTGGLISQAIDAYPLFVLSNGYTVKGSPGIVDDITNWLYQIDIDSLIWHGIIDSLVYGDGIQEIVYGRKGQVLYVVPRNPKFFEIDIDEYGMVMGYTQRVNNKTVTLKPSQVVNLELLSLSGESHGQSLIGRAYDDIMRDTKTADSTAVAIERHGYPRYHITAGSDDQQYSDDAKREIAREFEELKADNEFVTNPNITIKPIDVQGVSKIASYNEWSLSRLLGALGVPSQIIGTGESTTTYATASVEMESFDRRIKTMQKKVERCYNRLIDLKTGVSGQVKLTFNTNDLVSEE